jgi:hypothetical protein
MVLSLSSSTVTLYKAILVGQASSGRMSTCFMRSPALVMAFSDGWPTHVLQKEAQDIERTVKGHAIKAVAALAVFIQHAPHCINAAILAVRIRFRYLGHQTK